MKTLLGLLLLPFCLAVSRTLYALIQAIHPSSVAAVSLSAWWLLGGFVFWVVLFFALPRPFRSYVLAHELTHALWGWVMGARIKRLRISKNGGSVTLSKSNFLIALAPYFFPLYTVLVIVAHVGLSLFFDLRVYEPFWLGLVGLSWGFHLTFTISTLFDHQPDIHENGALFSYTLIYFMNVLGIGAWVVMVTPPTLASFGTQLGRESLIAWQACAAAAAAVWAFTAEHADKLSRHWKKS